MNRRSALAKISRLEDQIAVSVGGQPNTVWGIVSAKTQKVLRHIVYENGKWIETDRPAKFYTGEKLEPVIKTTKRFVVVLGGRGSLKSVGVHDIGLAGVADRGDKVMCMREFQESINDSVHSLLKDEIARNSLEGFKEFESFLNHENGGGIRYRGLSRNPSSVKSAAGFKRFIVEEAAKLSRTSIRTLTPTARNKALFGTPAEIRQGIEEAKSKNKDKLANVQMFFIANPESQSDPFSERFINPFLNEINTNGFYEDDLHLIVKINYVDNPWFEFSGLEEERAHDEKNLSDAEYAHIWLGDFMDEVDGSIITQDWFNAAIDADIKLGFKPTGAKIVSFDPADTGKDPKAVTIRHGSVILDCLQNKEGDAFTATAWACNIAKQESADHFIWDCDGMGATLREHVAMYLGGSRVITTQYRGSNDVANPEAIYSFENKGVQIRASSRNEDVFFNRRAQRIWELRDRFYMTWRAVTFGEYIHPDKMISIRSTIKDLNVLRAETCRIPRKKNDNGKIQILSKKEMAAAPYRLPSPNMFDSAVGSLDIPDIISAKPKAMPKPLKRMPLR